MSYRLKQKRITIEGGTQSITRYLEWLKKSGVNVMRSTIAGEDEAHLFAPADIWDSALEKEKEFQVMTTFTKLG